MTYGRPPFRADHVGSLLRPPELLRAREQYQQGTLSAESLRVIEDRSIRDVAKLQEEIGLQGITDGEYRRTIWHADFLRQVEGVSVKEGAADGDGVARKFRSGAQEIERSPTRFYTTGHLKRSRGFETENFKYLASVTDRTPKLCIPSPTILHMRGGRAAIDKQAYPDMEKFYAIWRASTAKRSTRWRMSVALISNLMIPTWPIFAMKRCGIACAISAKTPTGCRTLTPN